MPYLFDSLLERLEGRKYSNYFSAFCPFEEHKSPALLVYEDGYVCLSCRRTGSLDYLNKSIGSHFRPTQHLYTVSRVLPRWRNWEEKYGSLEGIAHAAHKSLKANTPFQTYFKRRKIYDFVEEGILGIMGGWIVFPVFDRTGSIIDLAVRSIRNDSDIRYVVHPSTDLSIRPLYAPSWSKVEQADLIYVVYGIIDSISLHLAGLPVVTGVTGKSLHPDLLLPLRKRMVILPDAGEEVEAHRLANKLGWRAKVKELSFPDGCNDPDDIRRKFGNEFLVQAVGA
jgi:hypothetical protein